MELSKNQKYLSPLAVCRLLGLSQEEGAMTYEDLKRSMNWDSKSHKLDARPLTSWSRLFGQLCRIPNNQILTLPARKKGCFIIKFSHDGRWDVWFWLFIALHTQTLKHIRGGWSH
jgi:hypothetical protein